MAGDVLVVLDAVTRVQGITTVLDAVTAGVSAGDAIGVVGRNGAGKTTLLDLVAGRIAPDAGRVTRASGLRTGLLAQRDELDDGATVQDAIVGPGVAEHAWRGDADVRRILAGLGIEPLLGRRVGSLSGGERRRVALAGLLVAELDLLLLDEPTNHLDVEGVAWLAAHLADPGARHRALLVVTHDRWFLDEVSTTTWEVAGGAIHGYDGGYSAYVLARAERARVADAADARRRNLVRKELAWLRRGAPARSSKPRYRVEAAEALIAAEPPPRDSVGLQRFAARRLGKSVLDVEGVTVELGGRTLLRDVTWRLGPGDRFALVGVNGAGKSTLLALLAGLRAPDRGAVRTGATVHLAQLSQDVRELPADRRVLEAVEDVARVLDLGGQQITASQLLERFGFAQARQWTPVADLSGGERRRLQLLRLLLTGPNVLLLDEPTNDLDVDTLVALEDLLDGWAGTLVVVSHDRWFLERVCDRTVALLGDGSLAELPGGVAEYLRRRQAAAETGVPEVGGRPRSGDTRAAGREVRRELVRLERLLDRLARDETALHGELAAAGADHLRAAELDVRLREVVRQKAEAEDRWLEVAAAAEQADG